MIGDERCECLLPTRVNRHRPAALTMPGIRAVFRVAWRPAVQNTRVKLAGEITSEGEVMSEVRVNLATTDGFRCRVAAGRHTLIADEPQPAGGTDEGPSPYELLLASLGACTAMTLRMYIERKQLPITEVEVLLSFDRIHAEDCESCAEGQRERNEEVQHISRIIYVTGEVTPEHRQRLLYIAGRCPVHVTLHSRPHVEDALIVRQ